MTIVWNKVTWYSKLLAAIFFIFVLPILTFWIGQKYEMTRTEIASYQSNISVANQDYQSSQDTLSHEPIRSAVLGSASIKTSCLNSDKNCLDKPFYGYLMVKDGEGNMVTTTQTRADGKFLIVLPSGKYYIMPTSGQPMPSIDPVSVLVNKNEVTKVALSFEANKP